jgi:hypothetical protein
VSVSQAEEMLHTVSPLRSSLSRLELILFFLPFLTLISSLVFAYDV